MKVPAAKKSYTVFSDNPKMDTSGMAGKPKQYDMEYEYKPPMMDIDDIMEMHEEKSNKRPEADDSNMRCRD